MRSNFHVSSFPMKGIRLCQCWHWCGHNLATICWMTTSMWIKEKGGGGSTHPYACLSRSTQDYERDFILMNYSTKDHWDPTPFSTHMVIMDDKVCVRVCMHCVCVWGGGRCLIYILIKVWNWELTLCDAHWSQQRCHMTYEQEYIYVYI